MKPSFMHYIFNFLFSVAVSWKCNSQVSFAVSWKCNSHAWLVKYVVNQFQRQHRSIMAHFRNQEAILALIGLLLGFVFWLCTILLVFSVWLC